ncbi:hypothetical protein TPHV1_230008 [Treponema phagedenis]|uniref:Uncharacterized protein n=1 Tax=Treponema phagedenis TaxID=162 RepID=A0A0B7GZ44_TREPH|nr:hypothetical protein TPHV1_230008 [Treponema phagedenis]
MKIKIILEYIDHKIVAHFIKSIYPIVNKFKNSIQFLIG